MARAGIPGLVSPRFPGAGSPWSLRGVMEKGCARKGLRAPPPGLLRTTRVEARGVWALGTTGVAAARLGAGWGSLGVAEAEGGRGTRDSPEGSRDTAGENWGRGQVSQVN